MNLSAVWNIVLQSQKEIMSLLESKKQNKMLLFNKKKHCYLNYSQSHGWAYLSQVVISTILVCDSMTHTHYTAIIVIVSCMSILYFMGSSWMICTCTFWLTCTLIIVTCPTRWVSYKVIWRTGTIFSCSPMGGQILKKYILTK